MREETDAWREAESYASIFHPSRYSRLICELSSGRPLISIFSLFHFNGDSEFRWAITPSKIVSVIGPARLKLDSACGILPTTASYHSW